MILIWNKLRFVSLRLLFASEFFQFPHLAAAASVRLFIPYSVSSPVCISSCPCPSGDSLSRETQLSSVR